MSIETRDPRFLDIVSEELELELLADGLGFTEGPIWHPTEKHLTFSDIPGNRIHRWQVRGSGLEVVREPSNMANGNTYDLIKVNLTKVLDEEELIIEFTTELTGETYNLDQDIDLDLEGVNTFKINAESELAISTETVTITRDTIVEGGDISIS